MPSPAATLEDYVEAFEKARVGRPDAALAPFLPDSLDPLYRPVLRELVRIDMEFGWESGRPRCLEDYRASYPDLFADPDGLREVAFEDYRLRLRAGERPTPQEYALRYGIRTDGWMEPDDLDVAPPPSLLFEPPSASEADREAAPSWRPADPDDDVPSLFRHLPAAERLAVGPPADDPERLPAAGETFAGFELLHELGRGAFGRVFLARQAALAGRLVALKVSPDVGAESQELAQLQHTHVVPIYSHHRMGALQAVCMPYCGAATLADVTRQLLPEAMPTTGADVFAFVRQKPRPEGVPAPPAEGCGELTRRGYVEAALWLTARLAEGLEHAHRRGILHRDVKPANVLLSDDGTPMLLDFNIAEDVKRRGPGAAALGGTLPYMAPEQLSAFLESQPDGPDARCDVYSLGVVLYELLTGRYPFPATMRKGVASLPMLMDMLRERGFVPEPRRANPRLSPAVASLVRHCLQPDPERRYQSAEELREDLDRHLADLPLKHAPDRSVGERARKWLRRNPRLPLVAGVAAALLLVALGAGAFWRGRQLDRAEKARLVRERFRDDYRRAEFYLNTRAETAGHARAGERACRDGLARFGVLSDPKWRERWPFASLTPARQEEVTGEVGEVLMLLAQAREDADVEEALELNRRAGECFGGPSPPVLTQRDRLRALAKLAAEEWQWPDRKPTAREQYLAARDLTRSGELAKARRLLDQATDREPGHYWAWFLRGYCSEGLRQDVEAAANYTVCVALMPDFHAAYLQRGLVRLRLRQFERAKDDFDAVARLEPDWAEARYLRALAWRGLKEHAKAVADLDAAQDLGFTASRVRFIRSASRRELGDAAGAKRDLDDGLKTPPTDEQDYNARGMARLGAKAPADALADFDSALKLNPRDRAALMNRAHVLADHLNRQKESAETLGKLLESYPDHVPALAGQAVVLARLGRRAEAHRQAAAALARGPDGEARYQVGCVYALTSKAEPADAAAAVAHLREAIDERFGLAFIDRDDDLAALRGRADFDKLVEAVKELRKR